MARRKTGSDLIWKQALNKSLQRHVPFLNQSLSVQRVKRSELLSKTIKTNRDAKFYDWLIIGHCAKCNGNTTVISLRDVDQENHLLMQTIDETSIECNRCEKLMSNINYYSMRKGEGDLNHEINKVQDTGACEVCDELIDPRRLEIFPDAKRCVICAGSSN